MSSDPPTSAHSENRRRWIRFRGDQSRVVLWTDADHMRFAQLLDESFGGVAVALLDVTGLNLEQEVVVEYKDVRMPAILRSMYPRHPDAHRVGFQWKVTYGGTTHPFGTPSGYSPGPK